jgi:hypothetical protein
MISRFYLSQQSQVVSPTLSTCQEEGIFDLGWPDWACYIRGPPLTTCWWDPAIFMSHLLMSPTWDIIPYKYLSHGSWPLVFLTPHLVPINIYMCPLMIFVGILTTKVTESCSLQSCFMLGLMMRTTMLGLDTLPPCRGLTRNSPHNTKD